MAINKNKFLDWLFKFFGLKIDFKVFKNSYKISRDSKSENNYIFEIYVSFPIDWCAFESNLNFDQNRPKCLTYSSGKFAIFAKNLTWVEKIMKNREKSSESNERLFRFLRLNLSIEILILKLWN